MALTHKYLKKEKGKDKMRTKAITINEPKLKQARLMCGIWPFFYITATPLAWATVSNIITVLSNMTQKRLWASLSVLTMGASLIMVYALFQFLLIPILELFRMSRPSGHYLVGQIFESPADCLEQNEKDAGKFHAAYALAKLLSCNKIGNFLNTVGPAYEISMIFCGFVLAAAIPMGSVVEALIVFSTFSLYGLAAEFGRRMVISHISEAGQIAPVQNKQ